jgi:hypothetical protein
MISGADVLTMLIPTGGWVIRGNNFQDIEFIECEPITKKEFTDGFAKCEAWQEAEDVKAKAVKAALLDRLGITAEEAALLLG